MPTSWSPHVYERPQRPIGGALSPPAEDPDPNQATFKGLRQSTLAGSKNMVWMGAELSIDPVALAEQRSRGEKSTESGGETQARGEQ